MNAESDGTMRIRGRLQGGHAYVLNGVDTKKQVVRVKNSYGKTWGKQGYGYLSFESLEKLLKDGGEICVPFEKKLSKIPTL
jgi:C1A family cysteine protease